MTRLLNHAIRENNGELAESNRGWLFTILLNHADGLLQCYPSDPLLAKEVGVSRPTIQKAREWLIQRGAIIVVPYDKRRKSLKHVHHRKIVYQITGVIYIKNHPDKDDSTFKVIPTLYFQDNEALDAHLDELEHIGFYCKASLQKEVLRKAILQKVSLHEVVTVFEVNTKKKVNTEKDMSSGDDGFKIPKDVRDNIFDHIGLKVWNINPEALQALPERTRKRTSSRIGMVASAICDIHLSKKTLPTIKHINLFVDEWYPDNYPDQSIPKDSGKWAEYYLSFYDEKKSQRTNGGSQSKGDMSPYRNQKQAWEKNNG